MLGRGAKIFGLAIAGALAATRPGLAREGFFRDVLPKENPPKEVVPRENVPQTECFSIAQTRQKIAQHRLIEPFLAMQSARGVGQGEAISARLCSVGDSFVYEIGLLRRDGHIVKVNVDAASGKAHPSRSDRPNP